MIETEFGIADMINLAEDRANRYWTSNVEAIQTAQPRLAWALRNEQVRDVEWVFARDGALTAMESGQRWWAGCSLPARAAEFMFRKADLSATVACFLCPTHAAQIRVALDRMDRPQALITLVPNVRALSILLACDDFAAEIAAHRLWFAWGDDWAGELDRLLEENAGLPTPTQFLRPILADSLPADELVPEAQRVFAEQSTRRSALARSHRESWRGGKLAKLCVVGPSRFRLWDDAGHALATALREESDDISILRYDPDDPAAASVAALAAAAAECQAIVVPNSGRGDLPEAVPDAMPWITWVTTPRIPPAERGMPADGLLVADPAWRELAIARGWKPDRVQIAGWPREELPSPVAREANFLAIIADTTTLDAPDQVVEFSSHRLFWEALREEILANPFVVGTDADAFLARRLRNANVGDGIKHSLFVSGLIVPAYQQGIARQLSGAGLATRVFGKGWDRLEDWTTAARGPIASRAALAEAARCAAAIVYVWPSTGRHPVEAVGRPVVRADKGRTRFLHDARLALTSGLANLEPEPATMKMNAIRRILSPFR